MSAEGLPAAFLPTPVFDARPAEVAYLLSVGAQAGGVLNFALIREATARVIEFVRTVAAGEVSQSQFSALVSLFPALFARPQSASAYPDALAALSVLLDAAQPRPTISHNGVVEELAQTAFDLVSRCLQVAKSAGAALIIHLLFKDHFWTSAAIVSGVSLSRQLIAARWTLAPYKEGNLRGLHGILALFWRLFADRRFVTIAEDRLAQIAALIEAGGERSAEAELRQADKIATLPPLERLAFLSTALTQAETNSAVAFELQVRVAAVIYGSLAASKKEVVPELDFRGLVPDAEVAVDLAKWKEEQWPLAVGSDEISAAGLRTALESAAGIAKQAGLSDQAARIAQLL
jgi:hypothetical protein